MVMNPPANVGDRFNPWVGRIPGKRKWLPTAVFLPGEFYGQRSLVGYSSWGHNESDRTEATNTFTLHDGWEVQQ